jgi:hypothetical protein
MHEKNITTHDKNITIHLLEYYSNLASHHRIMMVGFASTYIGINQALLLISVQNIKFVTICDPMLFLISAALLTTFILGSTLHHVSHFLSNSGVRSFLAADMHYQFLPENEQNIDPFSKWLIKSRGNVKQTLAVSSRSVLILGGVFFGLMIINAIIFVIFARTLLPNNDFYAISFFSGCIITLIILIGSYYKDIEEHYEYSKLANADLQLIIKSETRSDVLKAIRSRK